MIKVLLIVLSICVGVPSLFVGLWLFMDKVVFGEPRIKKRAYTEEKKNGKPCITFQQFFDWYSVNPAPWSWRDSSWPVSFGEYVIYKCEAYRTAELYWETYHDKYQFIQWVLAKEKQDMTKQSDKVLLYVMNHVQKDIEKRMAEIQQDTKTKLEKIIADQEAEVEKQKKLYETLYTKEQYIQRRDEEGRVQNEGMHM